MSHQTCSRLSVVHHSSLFYDEKLQMGRCYELSLLCENEDPLLPSVHCAIVLTMYDSQRIQEPTFDSVRKLCRRTYVQRNRGYRRCRKSACVVSSNTDIVHAYMNVCKEFKNVDGNVLILEDDAQLMSNVKRLDFYRVDDFLMREKYDLYTLGSFGCMYHVSRYHARILTYQSLENGSIGACSDPRPSRTQECTWVLQGR